MLTRIRHEVCLITGSLGSGKTTLLNKLLQCEALSGSMVLINEFGDVGLDHEIVREVKEDVVLLSSGCLCCSLKGDLRDELVTMVESLCSGEIEVSGPILIETTGLADPVPILQLINTDEVLNHHLMIKHVVTVVDSLNCHRQAEEFPEIDNQITLADLLVLSKTDLASASDQIASMALISRLNPLAARFEIGKAEQVTELVSAIVQNGHDFSLPAELPAVSGHRSLDEIDSFVFEFEGKVDRKVFFQWVQLLIQSQGERLLRMKGTIPFSEGTCYVHSTGPLFYPPDPSVAEDNVDTGKLICIGRGLDRSGIEASFSLACFGQSVPRRVLTRDVKRDASQVTIQVSTSSRIRSILSKVLPHHAVAGVNNLFHWNLHNPWSMSAQYFDAWKILEICEDPDLIAQITDILGNNINLIGSEVITQDTHWLSLSRGRLVADEARYLPVNPGQAVVCRIPIYGFGASARGVIHRLDSDWICPNTDQHWTYLSLYYSDGGILFDRAATHAANRVRNKERPLANASAMPIWLVSGQDSSGNNYAVGYNRPRPEWLQTSAA